MHTSVAQFVDDGFQVVTTRMAQYRIATGGRDRAQKRTGFDTVRHHLVPRTMQSLHTLNVYAAAAMPADACAHGNQQLGQVRNLGFLRGVFQHSFAVGQTCGHQQIFGAGDGDHVGGDARAFEP